MARARAHRALGPHESWARRSLTSRDAHRPREHNPHDHHQQQPQWEGDQRRPTPTAASHHGATEAPGPKSRPPSKAHQEPHADQTSPWDWRRHPRLVTLAGPGRGRAGASSDGATQGGWGSVGHPTASGATRWLGGAKSADGHCQQLGHDLRIWGPFPRRRAGCAAAGQGGAERIGRCGLSKQAMARARVHRTSGPRESWACSSLTSRDGHA